MPPPNFPASLARYRELAGLTQLQLATRSGTAHSSVNRWEKGGSLPKRDSAERLDAALEANGHLFTAWRRAAGGLGLPEWAQDLETIERSARRLTLVSPTLVPGYLQCPEYARAVFKAGLPLASPDEIQRLVELRTGRLGKLKDLQVAAVFPVLGLTGVSTEVRRAQARYLLSWADTGRVGLHLVPDGTVLLTPTSPLLIFVLDGGEITVVSDHADGNVVHDGGVHDRLMAYATDALAAALPAHLSLDVLRTHHE